MPGLAVLGAVDPGGANARSGEPGEEASLREAQRAWVTFRDAHCRLQSFEARGGSMQPMLLSQCKAYLTELRTEQLRNLSAGPE